MLAALTKQHTAKLLHPSIYYAGSLFFMKDILIGSVTVPHLWTFRQDTAALHKIKVKALMYIASRMHSDFRFQNELYHTPCFLIR